MIEIHFKKKEENKTFRDSNIFDPKTHVFLSVDDWYSNGMQPIINPNDKVLFSVSEPPISGDLVICLYDNTKGYIRYLIIDEDNPELYTLKAYDHSFPIVIKKKQDVKLKKIVYTLRA